MKFKEEMRLTISLVDKETNEEIFGISDATCNPFKLGDEVHLTVDDISYSHLDKYPFHLRSKMMDENIEMQKKYRLATAILEKEGKYVRFTKIGNVWTTIEYHCTVKPFEK